MTELIKLLNQTIASPVDWENDKDILSSGKINSIDLTELIIALEDAYGITITMEYMTPENFNSAEAILALIHELE